MGEEYQFPCPSGGRGALCVEMDFTQTFQATTKSNQQLQYFKIKITSNTISIDAFNGGLKCPRKILFNTQWGEGNPRRNSEMRGTILQLSQSAKTNEDNTCP